MSDEELLQQAVNCPTMYFDGFGAYRKINGVLRCVGFIFGPGAQLNLVVSLAGAELASRITQQTLDHNPVSEATVWNGNELAH